MKHAATDWDHYYKKPYRLNTYLKKTVTRRLIRYIRRHLSRVSGFTFVEFGGGNSCFYDIFDRMFKPSAYIVVDNNQVGLDELKKRTGDRQSLVLVNRDIMSNHLGSGTKKLGTGVVENGKNPKGDVVFSVGLIEHFSVEDTRKAILAHLDALNDGGILILGYPTPTLLYRVARSISQWLGMWIFHDERPLKSDEVLEPLETHCTLLDSGIIWSIIFTQAFVVLRKK